MSIPHEFSQRAAHTRSSAKQFNCSIELHSRTDTLTCWYSPTCYAHSAQEIYIFGTMGPTWRSIMSWEPEKRKTIKTQRTEMSFVNMEESRGKRQRQECNSLINNFTCERKLCKDFQLAFQFASPKTHFHQASTSPIPEWQCNGKWDRSHDLASWLTLITALTEYCFAVADAWCLNPALWKPGAIFYWYLGHSVSTRPTEIGNYCFKKCLFQLWETINCATMA